MSVRGLGRSRPLAWTWKWCATCKRIQTMVFEHIEKLQEEYMDKYVVVDDQRPELRRFKGMTGVVKTVNMSGRALVQFDSNNNIGWYDIDIDYLKVVDKPLPKEEPKLARVPPRPSRRRSLPHRPKSHPAVLRWTTCWLPPARGQVRRNPPRRPHLQTTRRKRLWTTSWLPREARERRRKRRPNLLRRNHPRRLIRRRRT